MAHSLILSLKPFGARMNKHISIISLTAIMVIALLATANAAEEEGSTPEGPTPGSYMGDREELSDLKSFLVQAAANNNELQAAFQQWQAAIKRAVRADTLPDPRLNFGYYTTPLETRGGPARYKYGMSQTLPFFGKLGSKEKIALREADGLKAKFDSFKLTTFLEVKKLYYEYAYLARAIEITRENIELMKYLEKIATSRYTTGSAKHSDIIRPQVELGKLEDRLNSLKDLKSPWLHASMPCSIAPPRPISPFRIPFRSCPSMTPTNLCSPN